MIRGLRTSSAFACFCIILLCLSSTAWSQRSTTTDLRPCFSEILQEKSVSFSNETFKLAMLSEWSYETYDSLRARGQLEAVIEDLPVGASYEQATVAVRKMFEKHSVNIDQSSMQASWNTRLDPAAKDILLECIRKTTFNKLGLSTDYRIIDEKKVILYLHWSWIDSSRLKIKTVSIHNATVDGDHPDSLLPPVAYTLGFVNPSLDSEAIVPLTRKDPNDDIDIVIETSPDVKAAAINIPKLAKNVQCQTTWPTVDETGAAQTYTFGPFDTSEKRFEKKDLGNAHHTWEISQNLTDVPNLANDKDSVFTNVTCSLYGTIRGWMDLDCGGPGTAECAGIGVNSRTAKCSGWWQNTGRQITMRVDWKRSKTSCKEVDWPKSN